MLWEEPHTRTNADRTVNVPELLPPHHRINLFRPVLQISKHFSTVCVRLWPSVVLDRVVPSCLKMILIGENQLCTVLKLITDCVFTGIKTFYGCESVLLYDDRAYET